MFLKRKMDKQRHSHTIEYYSATKKNKLFTHATTQMTLKNIILKGKKDRRKRLHDSIYMKFSSKKS